MHSFKIQYLGGIGRVTGSCTLVEHEGNSFLIDYGMIQGEEHADYENNKGLPIKSKNIKFVILTHAHLDHCGLIPVLAKNGFKGKIYCTKATKRLAIEILNDSATISGMYSRETISELNFQCIDDRDNFKWGRLLPIDYNLMIALYRSAHILGSTSVVIANRETKETIWFSGDVGRNCREDSSQPLLKYRQGPDSRNNLVVCESTYGANSSPEKSASFEERQYYYSKLFEQTLTGDGGDVIIPAFSLQRTQDILADLFILFKSNPDLCNGVSVVCDSPLAKRISAIYADEMFRSKTENGETSYQYLNPELVSRLSRYGSNSIEALENMYRSTNTTIGKHTIEFTSKCNPSEPTVYISSAGMCNAGKVIDHFKRTLGHKNNTVLLTGYQANGTAGSKLAAIMTGGTLEDKPLFPDSDIIPSAVKAKIQSISFYSGHADKKGLVNYLFNEKKQFCPPAIHLNHGDDKARNGLKSAIKERFDMLDSNSPGTYSRPKVLAPTVNTRYVLNEDGVHEESRKNNSQKQEELIKSLYEKLEKQETEIERMKRNL